MCALLAGSNRCGISANEMATLSKKITVLTTGEILAENAEIADTPFKRFKGLLGRNALPPNHALVITCCNCVHMFFMRFAIDVIFCDASNRVLRVCENLKPWHISPYVLGARYVIELPAGTIRKRSIQINDSISIT